MERKRIGMQLTGTYLEIALHRKGNDHVPVLCSPGYCRGVFTEIYAAKPQFFRRKLAACVYEDFRKLE